MPNRDNRAEPIVDFSATPKWNLQAKTDLIAIALVLGVSCKNVDELKELLVERKTTMILGINGWAELQQDGRLRSRTESIVETVQALGKYAEVKFPVDYAGYYSKVVPIVREERLKQAEGYIAAMNRVFNGGA